MSKGDDEIEKVAELVADADISDHPTSTENDNINILSSSPAPQPLAPRRQGIKLTATPSTTSNRNTTINNDINNSNNEYLPTEIILIRREKKISIQVPEINKNEIISNIPITSLRLYRVYLSTKKYIHLYNEIIGGIYGLSSRPELEIHSFSYYYTYPVTMENKLMNIELIYDPVINLYIITSHIEDKLLLYCEQNKTLPSLYYQSLTSAIMRNGNHEFQTLTLDKQKQWRKFLRFYIFPFLNNEERINKAKNYMKELVENQDLDGYITPEDSDLDETSSSESDDEKTKKKKRKGKKKGTHTSGNKTIGGSGTVSKSTTKKKEKSSKKGSSKGTKKSN